MSLVKETSSFFDQFLFLSSNSLNHFWRSVRGLPQQAGIEATSSGKHFSYLNLPMKTELSPFVYHIGMHMVLALLPVISIVDYFTQKGSSIVELYEKVGGPRRALPF